MNTQDPIKFRFGGDLELPLKGLDKFITSLGGVVNDDTIIDPDENQEDSAGHRVDKEAGIILRLLESILNQPARKNFIPDSRSLARVDQMLSLFT